jgi:hypothetical protein
VVPIAVTASPAMAMCAVDTVSYSTPYAGSRVIIPTSLAAGPYQKGGTQSVSYSDGDLYSKTTGSSDSAGGSGEVGWGWGKVSATYNHTWNRSTTYSTSHTKTYTTTSPQLPKKYLTRWTLFHKAWKFKVKQIVTYTNNCPTQIHWRTVALPTNSWSQTNLAWHIQYAAHPHRWYAWS